MSCIKKLDEELKETFKQKIKHVCNKCNKRFPNASKLRQHKISHNSHQFQCNLCQKLFKLKSSLQRHRLHNHEFIKKHKCSKCNVSFAQRINLLMHQERLHSRLTNFKCTQCDCCFKRLNDLSRHKRSCRTEHVTTAEHLSLEDDANSLAKLVVTQLKSLEAGMSSLQTQEIVTTALGNDHVEEKTEETTFVEQAKFGETDLQAKLNPNKITETLKVQTVKRPGKRLAYVCEHCAKEFFKSYNLIRHLRTHTVERPYNCTICCSTFTTKTHLAAHFKRMHVLDEKTGFMDHQHKCYICFMNFSSMRKLDLHMKTHVDQHCVQYFCGVCKGKFRSKTAFSTHNHKSADQELTALEQLLPEPLIFVDENTMALKTTKEVFFCNLQQRIQQNFFKHKKQHERNKKFKCQVCGSTYLSNTSLRTHQKLHQNMKRLFRCTVCANRHFPTKSQLERHKSHTHCDERNFQCHYCTECFKTAAHCKSHMRRHLRNLLGPPQQQNTHELPTPSGSAQLIIQEKNAISNTAKFIQIEMLPRHPKFKHRNIKVELASENPLHETQTCKHKCTQCEKKFQKPSDLTRHLRLHTQERPFSCDSCGKTFKLKSTLDDHRKTHLSDVERLKMSVACQVCGKTYASQKSLTVHLRLHTGNYPFKCESCGKLFRTSGHRLAHLNAAKSKNGNCITNS